MQILYADILMYADDMVLICEDPRQLIQFIEAFEKATSDWGMKINVAKTEIM